MRWEQPLISCPLPLACVPSAPQDYDSAGHITIDTLAKAMMPTAPQDCVFYFCGPVAWMIGFRGTSPNRLTLALPRVLAADPPLLHLCLYSRPALAGCAGQRGALRVFRAGDRRYRDQPALPPRLSGWHVRSIKNKVLSRQVLIDSCEQGGIYSSSLPHAAYNRKGSVCTRFACSDQFEARCTLLAGHGRSCIAFSRLRL